MVEKAIVAKIQYAGMEFEGLMLPDNKWEIKLPTSELDKCWQYECSSVIFISKDNHNAILDFSPGEDRLLHMHLNMYWCNNGIVENLSSNADYDNFVDYIHLKYNLDTDKLYKLSFPKNDLYTAFLLKDLLSECKPISKTNKQYIEPEKLGDIYMLELDGCIKIGFTTNIESRIATYKTSSRLVKLLYKTSGTIKQEKLFHKLNNQGEEKYNKEDYPYLLKKLFKIN